MAPFVLLIGMALVAISATATTFLLRPEGRIDAGITWGVVAIVDVVGATLLVGVTGLLHTGPLPRSTGRGDRSVGAAEATGMATYQSARAAA